MKIIEDNMASWASGSGGVFSKVDRLLGKTMKYNIK